MFREDEYAKKIVGAMSGNDLTYNYLRLKLGITSGRRRIKYIEKLKREGLIYEKSDDKKSNCSFLLTEKGAIYCLLLPSKYYKLESLLERYHRMNIPLKVAYAMTLLGNEGMIIELISLFKDNLPRIKGSISKRLAVLGTLDFELLLTKKIEIWYHKAIQILLDDKTAIRYTQTNTHNNKTEKKRVTTTVGHITAIRYQLAKRRDEEPVYIAGKMADALFPYYLRKKKKQSRLS